MNRYETPQKSIEINVPMPNRESRVNTNKLFVVIALICFAAAAAVIAVHLMSGSPVNAAAVSPVPPSSGSIIETENALTDRLIVIDAGHGGFDPGTIGVTGTEEDGLNLLVANHLKGALEAYGAKVIMTRSNEKALAETKDEDMAKRRQIITDSGSDIVVSIHMNSFSDSSVSGPLVIFMQGSVKGEKLAKNIQQKLLEALKPEQENSARSGDLYILRSGLQPCVIVECGYLSNEKEEKLLLQDDYQEKLADAICSGVNQYFSSIKE
jgi:N-acetylmuramoyl-L-alanine amidase